MAPRRPEGFLVALDSDATGVVDIVVAEFVAGAGVVVVVVVVAGGDGGGGGTDADVDVDVGADVDVDADVDAIAVAVAVADKGTLEAEVSLDCPDPRQAFG